MALAIAAGGLYGTISYLVGRRRKEIGIRLALGARRQQVRSWILGQGFVLAACGIGVGLLLAVAATHLLGSMLHGVATANLPMTRSEWWYSLGALPLGIAVCWVLRSAPVSSKVATPGI